MWEALTETLRQVFDDAHLEAKALNQEFVGTEHLVLGMLECEGCEARRALVLAGLDVDEFRNALLRELPLGEREPGVDGPLPLSPKAQRAVNAAVASARLRREPRVHMRAVLAALLEEPGTLIRQAIEECGADVELVAHLLGEPPAEEEDERAKR